jgi:hypothetical protein
MLEQIKQEFVNIVEQNLAQILKQNSFLIESFDQDDIRILDKFISDIISKSINQEINFIADKITEDGNIQDTIEQLKPLIIEATILKVLSGIDTIRRITESVIDREPSIEEFELVIEACKSRSKKKKKQK